MTVVEEQQVQMTAVLGLDAPPATAASAPALREAARMLAPLVPSAMGDGLQIQPEQAVLDAAARINTNAHALGGLQVGLLAFASL